MNIYLLGRVIDDESKLVYYRAVVENEKFKATVEFHDEIDIFKTFAEHLQKFPFESKDSVILKTGGFNIEVSLAGAFGRIDFKVDIRDWDQNKVHFNDKSITTSDLQTLALKLKSLKSDNFELMWSTTE